MDAGGRTELSWGGERWTLLAERALWWERRGTLVVADVHLGKAASFRAAGLPVPDGHGEADLRRLSALIGRFSPERLVLLGDLLHARTGRSPQTLAELAGFRARHPRLSVLLVRGNHDTSAGDPPHELGFVACDEPRTSPDDGLIAFAHHPSVAIDRPALCGHLHPAVTLRGAGHRARPACFWFGPSRCVLPAFGTFTGSAIVRPARGDRVFAVGAVGSGEIVEIECGDTLPRQPAGAG